MANNQMPHNLEAEKALLSCILIDADVQSEILAELREEDFYQESNRIILNAMKAVVGSGKPVDVVTLTDQLDKDKKLSGAGGVQAITELSQYMPSAANYKHYHSIIRRDSVNRSLIRAANSIIETCRTSPEEREAVAFSEKAVYDVSRRGETSGLKGLSDGETVHSVIEKFEIIASNPGAFRGYETGFSQLDTITNGLQRSDLIVIAARPGVGKTSLAMNIVENGLRQGKVVAVFSLEMPREQLVQRLVCAYSRVSMERALAGKLKQSDWKKFFQASDKLIKSKLFIDDNSRISPAEILSKCRRLKSAEGRLDLIMLDYIQLMGSEDVRTGTDSKNRSHLAENRQQEIASFTRELKIMAKELNVPVIALSQIRRIQTQEPQLSDLRESGAIEQDADIVMFISKSDEKKPKKGDEDKVVSKDARDLIIAKHRNGATGRIQMRFIGEQTRFVETADQGREEEDPYHSSGRNDGAYEEYDDDGEYDEQDDSDFDDGEDGE